MKLSKTLFVITYVSQILFLYVFDDLMIRTKITHLAS